MMNAKINENEKTEKIFNLIFKIYYFISALFQLTKMFYKF